MLATDRADMLVDAIDFNKIICVASLAHSLGDSRNNAWYRLHTTFSSSSFL
jgi:hypothetical protein